MSRVAVRFLSMTAGMIGIALMGAATGIELDRDSMMIAALSVAWALDGDK